jgi:hypothetical protein
VFVALGMQLAERKRRVLLLSVPCCALQTVSSLSHKQYEVKKKVTDHNVCVSIFSPSFRPNIFHFKKN